jgi:hypothetical protein
MSPEISILGDLKLHAVCVHDFWNFDWFDIFSTTFLNLENFAECSVHLSSVVLIFGRILNNQRGVTL